MLESFFNKKEALTQVFSCEIWEISKDTYFGEHTSKDHLQENLSVSYLFLRMDFHG